jgi:CBS domain-containing protein
MVRNVKSVAETAALSAVVRSMLREKVSAVPVVDEHDDVVGVVSSTDLVHRVTELLPEPK